MRILQGPFGLTKLDFYEGEAAKPKIKRDRAVMVTSGYFVTVDNAHRRLADGYFTGPEEEWEQAEQWLLDMVVLRSKE